MPDSITTSATGTMVICEDGSEGNHLRGSSPKGEIFDFAKDNIVDRLDDEFAGASFRHDHKTLYVNVQASQGRTFTIWGPWGAAASDPRSGRFSTGGDRTLGSGPHRRR